MILFQEQTEQDRLVREKIEADKRVTKNRKLLDMYSGEISLKSIADAWSVKPWGMDR